MEPKYFTCPEAGKVVRTPEGYHAFVPAPPPGIAYEPELVLMLSRADAAVSELAGLIGRSGWTDGPAGTAGVSETLALAGRADGQVILLDGATSRVRTVFGGNVETLAGGQRGGTVDGPGEGAGFGWPRGVAVASDGSLLVADALEHSLRQVILGP